MNEKYIQLENLTNDPEKVKAIFSGTKEDMMKNLANEGIELSDAEFEELVKGALSTVSESEDLSIEDLDNVSGGCSSCEAVGQKIGRILGKILYQIFGNK